MGLLVADRRDPSQETAKSRARPDSAAVTLRAAQAHLDITMTLEQWDQTAKVTYDRALWNELVELRFLDRHAHIAIVGPVGTGKTFLAHTLGRVCVIAGSRVLVAFFIELGAAMIVASTIVPAFGSSRFSLSRALIVAKITPPPPPSIAIPPYFIRSTCAEVP